MKETRFKLKDVLRDEVSGFEGVALAVVFYAEGCTHFGLAQQKLKGDGSVAAWQWFDETRLLLVKSGCECTKSIPTGGPDRNPRCM